MFHCLFSIYSTPTCCNNRVVWTDGTIHFIFNLYESLEERLGSLKERGVVSNGKTTVEEIYADRAALYKKYADITLNEQGKQIRETVEMLYDIIMNKDQYN